MFSGHAALLVQESVEVHGPDAAAAPVLVPEVASHRRTISRDDPERILLTPFGYVLPLMEDRRTGVVCADLQVSFWALIDLKTQTD